MSFIVKGIDLPKRGEDLTIEINSDGWVRAYSTEPKFTNHLIKAIQIRRPHGRLMDADKLESHEEFDGYGFTKSVYVDDIEDAPTILEAEE